jgi:putative ABC transport system permease protein
VAVDWQVQVTPGGDAAAVQKAIGAVPGLIGQRRVDYAKVPGLQSDSASGRRTTGAALLVSLPADYRSFAPGELRALVGDPTAIALQQQTDRVPG